MEVSEVYAILQTIYDMLGEDATLELPPELLEYIAALADGEANTDTEVSLDEIKKLLSDEEDKSYLSEMSERLDIIDKRLDTEFMAFNSGFSLLLGGVAFYVIWTLLTFAFNRLKNV